MSRVNEIRCQRCGRLLLRAESLRNAEIKCPKCGHLNRFTAPSARDKLARPEATKAI
ncbi:MAG: Com family DNA-binding transcriptional regulator [Candidatus Zixiibacteriota bacterium]